MTFAYILRTLARRWPILLAAALVGALAGALFSQATPERYEATASLVVTPVTSNPITGAREEVNIRTEQEILGSREVARRAAEELGDTPSDDTPLSADVEVAAPTGSQILQVTVRGATPDEAAERANAVAAAYLEMRRESESEASERYVESVDQQLEDLRAEDSTPATDSLIERLQQQRSSMALSDPEPGRIIGPATPPTSPSGPGLPATMAGAAMAGLLLGVCLAILRERTDSQLRSAERLELSAGRLSVIEGNGNDESFWIDLADEAIKRSRVDLEHEQVSVLLHGVPPVATRALVSKFLSAARTILMDSRDGLLWSSENSDIEAVPRSSKGDVRIIPSGTYQATVIQSARRSDIAVIIATPHSQLTEVSELVTTLRKHGLETVVGLASGTPLSTDATHQAEAVNRPSADQPDPSRAPQEEVTVPTRD